MVEGRFASPDPELALRHAQPGLMIWLIREELAGSLATNDEIPEDFTLAVQTGFTEFYLFPDFKTARRYINKYLPLDPQLVPIENVPLLNASALGGEG